MPKVSHELGERLKHTMHTAGAPVHAQRMVRQYVTSTYEPASPGPDARRSAHGVTRPVSQSPPRASRRKGYRPGRDGPVRGCDGRAQIRPPPSASAVTHMNGRVLALRPHRAVWVSGERLCACSRGGCWHPTTVVMRCISRCARRHPSLERTGSPLIRSRSAGDERAWLTALWFPRASARRSKVFFIEHPDFSTARESTATMAATTRTTPVARVPFLSSPSSRPSRKQQVCTRTTGTGPWHRCFLRTGRSFAAEPFYKPAGGRAAVHNAGFQGHFPPETVSQTSVFPGAITSPAFRMVRSNECPQGGVGILDTP